MKPIKLIIQAFGPFAGREIIDFDSLSKDGIFLIKGPTGSGKTTIFDAMTYALYGGSSGDDSKKKNGRNAIEEWRCSQADDDTDTVVELTFTAFEKTYIFRRCFVKKRSAFSRSCGAMEVMPDGNEVPLFENPKDSLLNELAEKLIGLDKEQFRQVILLPQGQFEKFLTANSDEKDKILSKIFNVVKWGGFAEKFFKKVSDRKDELLKLNSSVKNSLNDEGLESVEDLEDKIGSLNLELEALKKGHLAFNGVKRQEELNRDIALEQKFKELLRLSAAAEELAKQKDHIEEQKIQLDRAVKAEAIRPFIQECSQKEKESANRAALLLKAKECLEPARKAVTEAAGSLALHLEASPVAELTAQMGNYEAKRDIYRNIDRLRAEAVEAGKAAEEALKEQDKAKANLDRIKKQAASLRTEYEESLKEASDYRKRYFDGIYGEIASGLQNGEPCPVCGSREHPCCAASDSNSVSKADVEKKEKNAELKQAQFYKADKDREAAQEVAEARGVQANEAALRSKAAQTALQEAGKNLIEGINDSESLELEIGKIKTAIEEFNKKTEKLSSIKEAKESDLTKVETRIKEAEREEADARSAEAEARKALNTALEENGYAGRENAEADLMADAERKAMTEEISSYEGRVKGTLEMHREKQLELQGLERPDGELFDSRQAEITDENQTYNDRAGKLSHERERLGKKLVELKAKYAVYKENITQVESDFAFAKSLRGDTGVGLQRYVLGVMFGQVIGEANRMLESVHGGRYQLYRTDDKGSGNKRGLELKVHDSRSPEREGRAVGLLSGGEKFLVSLALSIGMSQVTQKSGVQIDALFIDEGFGTLDDSSIADAMDVLSSVRTGSNMIGIISHVQLLEANIPMHLEVVKTEQGSHVRVC